MPSKMGKIAAKLTLRFRIFRTPRGHAAHVKTVTAFHGVVVQLSGVVVGFWLVTTGAAAASLETGKRK